MFCRWSCEQKFRLLFSICILFGIILFNIILFKVLYYIGSNMGPPNTSREVRRYLQRNQLGLADECVDRLLNFGLLSDDEALRFMATENGGIWDFVGENPSVSDDVMIKGYNMLTDEGKNKFRDQWRYWGWTRNRMKLANDVWREQKDKESKSQGKCTLWFPIVNE